jgi:hypothetical protein
MSATADRTVVARALENALERRRRSARAGDGRVLVEGDGLLLIASPDMPWISGARLVRAPADPAATIARVRAFFARHDLTDWDLTAADEVADAVGPALEAAGFIRAERRPGMLLSPLGGAPTSVPGLEIRAVAGGAGLADFIATSAAGFESEAELYARLYTPALVADPDLTLYVGFLDGAPVATAVRGTSFRIAGIGGVSTVPAARRRGIGAAITWRAALDGLAEGCIASFLEATPMGYRVYERMGYRHVIDFQTWSPVST